MSAAREREAREARAQAELLEAIRLQLDDLASGLRELRDPPITSRILQEVSRTTVAIDAELERCLHAADLHSMYIPAQAPEPQNADPRRTLPSSIARRHKAVDSLLGNGAAVLDGVMDRAVVAVARSASRRTAREIRDQLSLWAAALPHGINERHSSTVPRRARVTPDELRWNITTCEASIAELQSQIRALCESAEVKQASSLMDRFEDSEAALGHVAEKKRLRLQQLRAEFGQAASAAHDEFFKECKLIEASCREELDLVQQDDDRWHTEHADALRSFAVEKLSSEIAAVQAQLATYEASQSARR
jgi:hypothetical protein